MLISQKSKKIIDSAGLLDAGMSAHREKLGQEE